MKLRTRTRRAADGLSLVEMAVAAGVGSLVLMVVAMLSVYALRSFGTMGNHAILDAQNRIALDKITRDLREARLTAATLPNATIPWLKFTNSVRGGTFKYVWYSDERKLICERDAGEETYLTDCDAWHAAFFRRTPLANSPFAFTPATNSFGAVDPGDCKMVEMTWKCSRSVFGKKFNTEAVQRARVTLRNMN